MSRPFSFASLAFVALFAGFAQAQLPAFVTQTPTAGNSANTFFVFLPVANVGSGDASNIQLTSVTLNFMGTPATTVIQPATLPFTPGTGFLGAGGVRILDLEFDNTALVSGNSYALVVSGTYQANGTTNNFMLNYSPLVYATGFTATHEQLLDVIGWKFDARPGRDRIADDQGLVTFMSGLPQVASAGLGNPPTTVWAKFSDGREQIIILNNSPSPPSPFQPLPENRVRPAASPARKTTLLPETRLPADTGGTAFGGPTDLPKSIKARLLFAAGDFANPIPDLETWLHKQGYSDAIGADASLASLRNVGGDGIFYINSHGGVSSGDANGKGAYPFNVWTATPTSDTPDAQLQEDLCPNPERPFPCGDDPEARLVDVHVDDGVNLFTGDPQSVHHYGITAFFINHYWRNFAANALVYIDTCESDFSDPSVTNFKDAIFAKGASVYAGWSDEVGNMFSANSARLVFDRLLGANAFCPEDGQPCHPGRAEPPNFAQRPFDYTQVQADLDYHSLRKFDSATLSFTPNPYTPTSFGLLAPSISYLAMDELKQQLTIYGVFGQDPRPNGWVTVGGTAAEGGPDVAGGTQVNIASWDWDHIVVDLPLTGPGSAGNVQVTVRLHKSNVAQLTEWRGNQYTFTINGDQPLQQKQVFNFHLRADVRKWRRMIHVPPAEPVGGIASALDSTGTYASNGTATKCVANSCTSYTWSGSGTLLVGEAGLTAGNGLALGGSVDNSKQMTVLVGVTATAPGLSCKFCSGSSCSTDSYPIFGPSQMMANLSLPSFDQPFTFILDPASSQIEGGSFPYQSPPALFPPSCQFDQNGSGQFQWGPVPATDNTTPNPDSAR